MNYLFRDASTEVVKKAYYHQQNHIIPYMKLTTLQAAEIECGSDVSNLKTKAKKGKKHVDDKRAANQTLGNLTEIA